jgi:predicted RNA-binding Zn ribbon-like protein
VEFEFITGRPVLDFVATVAERGTTDDDALRTPEDLQTWIAESGLVDFPVSLDGTDLTEAKRAREAMYGLVAALIERRHPPSADRELVNRLANHPQPTRRLTARGEVTRQGDLSTVLAVLANDCLDLYAGPDRELLRRCAAARCTRPFVDRSRGHRRRWCDMKSCGDKVKAAAYRQRLRSTSED